MRKEEVDRVVKLREFLINYYSGLEGKSEPSSVTKTSEIALFCESVIRSTDDILRPYVKFE